jgi:hypothetical protein
MSSLLLDLIDFDLDNATDKSALGCYVFKGKRLIGVLVYKDPDQALEIPIGSGPSTETLSFVVKSMGDSESRLGSLSLTIKKFCELQNKKKYT